MRLVSVALCLLMFTTPAIAEQLSAKSPRCGEVVGKTAKDRDAALKFCSAGTMADGIAIGVIAQESLVWIKVRRDVADAMIADSVSTEQIVKNWMAAWRLITGLKAVTITVETGSVEIAKGDTSMFSGDKVTVRPR